MMKTEMTRRSALAGGLALAAPATAALPALGDEPDPIFALIEKHKAAEAAYDALFGGNAEESMTEEEWFAITADRADCMGYALEEVVATMPPTLYGVACVLRYLGSPHSC